MLKSLLHLYPPLSRIREALAGSGKRVFLVGGALRDYYVKGRGHDLDFAVDNGAIALSRKVARRIKGSFVLLDKEHGSARVVKKLDKEIWTFDFTDWRGKGIQEDLYLRDFTVNAMAVDILAGAPKLLEVQGARRDLDTGLVRMTNPKAFQEDPLRLLRAFSLTAGLGFKIEAKTLRQIKKDAPLISKVAVERIREEIFRILASRRAYETCRAMDAIGLLPQVIPQLTVMKGVHQGGFH
ncbi:MAG: CCA tRNA nucleotidyltransferase, partial [Candidatus Omnitrophica bacterium]|nr:CCA tRNA nucleotidyltransferase [Candidatus Omnitrophota bacterium]